MDLQATSKTNKRATIYSLQVAFNERCYRDEYRELFYNRPVLYNGKKCDFA